jgi:MoxR-like ATPase
MNSGGAVYRPNTGEFEIRTGPLFAQVFLADEINRASPRTQSALLEAMEERQVTLEGVAHGLPEPFMVLATQNPVEFHGVFPLPEAQLDRFLIRLKLGYPDEETERAILRSHRSEEPIRKLSAVVSPAQVLDAQARVRGLHVDPTVEAYAVSLVRATRSRTDLRLGASPRSGILLLRAAQAWAFLDGRDHVLPDDIQDLLLPVLSHRIHSRESSDADASERVLEEIREAVPVPR